MFQDKDITQYPDISFIDYQDSMQCIRGKEISMIFQNPANYFDPTMKIGKQIYETLCAHDKIPLLERKKRAISLLEQFQVPDPSRALKKYPVELSIGTLQKIAIALAFVHKPKLILADEPFSSIDELSKQSLIQIFKKYQKKYGITILHSLHDLNDIKELLFALGGKKKTILSFAGFGDILMTSTSSSSRNFSFGCLIGEGKSKQVVDNYLKETTVEGMYTLQSIHKLVKKKNVKMPIINLIYDIINGKKDKEEILSFLIEK